MLEHEGVRNYRYRVFNRSNYIMKDVKKQEIPYMKAPCSNCPFKKTALKGWLGRERAEDIVNAEGFICHKTIGKKEKQCSGHMQVAKGRNMLVRMSMIFGDELELSNGDSLFDNADDFINHHDFEECE